MGCDIHFFVEVRKNGVWTFADPRGLWEENMAESAEESWERYTHWTGKAPDFIYSSRNYDLFGILANVRNGTGFAGAVTGKGFVPISYPKGIPKDASEEYKRAVANYGPDGHSHSWLTVQELLDYDWNQTTEQQGTLSLQEYSEWRKDKNQPPNSYSGAVWGDSIVLVRNSTMDEILDRVGEDLQQALQVLGGEYYTQVTWPITYKKVCEPFITKTLPALKELGNPEDVRIVFFFDN